MTKEKITNGKYWLVIAKYPFPGFETYTLIKSDKNPEYYYKFNKKIVPEIIEDSELEENIDIIHDSLDFSEMFSFYNYSVNVNINKLINSITDVLIDLKLYKEINIDRYYIESVINKSLPYKITTYETN